MKRNKKRNAPRIKPARHTATFRGKRVVVVLNDGTILEDHFVDRAKNNRWIELRKAGRIAKSDIKSFANLKGPLDLKRLKGHA